MESLPGLPGRRDAHPPHACMERSSPPYSLTLLTHTHTHTSGHTSHAHTPASEDQQTPLSVFSFQGDEEEEEGQKNNNNFF